MRKRIVAVLVTLLLVMPACFCSNVGAVSVDTPHETISLGGRHSAAIKKDGSLWMWGKNDRGQLGDGTINSDELDPPYEKKPKKILDNVSSVSLGEGHTAAIKKDGSLWIWGYNACGQLGNGAPFGTRDNNINTPFHLMDNVVSVKLGYVDSFCIKSDNSLWAWGKNACGMHGDGTSVSRNYPTKVMSDVATVEVRLWISAFIKTDGSLWMCGYNYHGELGDGTTQKRVSPVKVMDDVSAVSIGGNHVLAIKKDESLWAWGYNGDGQLGDGTTENKTTPTKIMENVAWISAGNCHSAAIKTDGSLWVWGENEYGQLGDGTKENKSTPIKIMDDVASVSLGGDNSLVEKVDGSLWAWGENSYGQLGSDKELFNIVNTPMKVLDDIMLPKSYVHVDNTDDVRTEQKRKIHVVKKSNEKLCEYLTNNGISFAYLGDANDDGILNSHDLDLYAHSLCTGSVINKMVCDMDGDGKITLKDLSEVMKEVINTN